MRSALFVPADNKKKLNKAVETEADAIIVDLEDSVAPDNKKIAKKIASEFLGCHTKKNQRMYVRVNSFDTKMTEDDLNDVMSTKPHGIVLPKCEGNADITKLDAMLRVHEAENGIQDGQTKIIAIITETAQALANIHSYKKNPRLEGFAWGAEDLAADVGATKRRNEDETYRDLFWYARTQTLIAAVVAETQPIDTVFTNFKNDDGLLEECKEAVCDGFTAKLAIHPNQIKIINDAFGVSDEQIKKAEEIVKTFEKNKGQGVVAMDGVMLDQPHLKQAINILKRAKMTD